MISPSRVIVKTPSAVRCLIASLGSARLLRPSYSVQEAKAVGPSVLHPQDRGDGENQNEPPQTAILRQVHKKQQGEAGLDDRDGQHANQHLGRTDILIGDDELDRGQDQQANVDAYVFSDSTVLV